MKCTACSLRIACLLLALTSALSSNPLVGGCQAGEPVEGVSTREARLLAARGVPLQRLNPNVSNEVREVLEHPSYFRRMPSQQIACDPQMFTFLVRRPEVMVNIWEVMGITKVKAQRTSPLSFMADDGVGTACKCDLIYSEGDLHIYFGNGTYDGSMSPRKVTGRCVCVLRTVDQSQVGRSQNIEGTMDVFLKVDNFGADLLTRTIGPFVGKTADYNFVETAKFISQISQVCQNNPTAAQALVSRLNRIDGNTRREFGEIVDRIGSSNSRFESYQAFSSRSAGTAASNSSLELAQSVPSTRANFTDSQPAVGYAHPATMALDDRSEQPVHTLPSPAAILPRKSTIIMRR